MIYFIQVGVDGPIKIGFTESANGKSRLDGIQCHCPYQLRLSGIIRDGDREKERELHGLFRENWIRGEWFTPSPVLLAYIAENTTVADSPKERRSKNDKATCLPMVAPGVQASPLSTRRRGRAQALTHAQARDFRDLLFSTLGGYGLTTTQIEQVCASAAKGRRQIQRRLAAGRPESTG